MPQVIFSPNAIRDLQRLRDFLHKKNRDAARRAGKAIWNGVQLLGSNPMIGRFVDDLPEYYREWFIQFGHSGYIARYRIDEEKVTILAVRHQKELDF